MTEKEDFFEHLLDEWETYEKKGKKRFKETTQTISEKNNQINTFIKQNPYVSVTLAFLAGYFLAKMKK